jgi:hypothetical protein
MKVQLSDKEYVSNFEGHWFESMLSHFFINYLRPMGWWADTAVSGGDWVYE